MSESSLEVGLVFTFPALAFYLENWASYILGQVGDLDIKLVWKEEKPLNMLPYTQDSSVFHSENT